MSVLNLFRWLTVGALIAVLALPAIFVSVTQVKVVEVDGRSMEPTIHIGDVAIIAPPHEDDFVVGAMVTASDSSGEKYTHRIVGLDPSGDLLLKGDNNQVGDPAPVPRKEIVGVVKAVFSGASATLVTQLQGWPLRICVLVMVIGLIFLPVSSAARRRRRGRQGASGSMAETGDLQPISTRQLTEGQREEALGLVESMRSSMARALLASPRRLTGQMTVATEGQDTDGFPDLRVVIRIAEKREGAAHAMSAPVAPQSTGPVAELPSRRQLRSIEKPRQLVPAREAGRDTVVRVPERADGQALMWTRPSGSVPTDLPSRRDQRNATRHGRRRAS